MDSAVDILAKKIWDYHNLRQTVAPADCILAIGSSDTRVAGRAADLFLAGYAPYLIVSGGFGRITEGQSRPEARVFADIALARGVPADKILIEDKATNTGDNILFTKQLLHEKGLVFQSFILVQKPYMERRAYAAFRKLWPEKEVVVTSPAISYEDYPTAALSRDFLINMMVGDLYRIKIYAAKGFQIPQEIPADVWQAAEELIRLGYDAQLPK